MLGRSRVVASAERPTLRSSGRGGRAFNYPRTNRRARLTHTLEGELEMCEICEKYDTEIEVHSPGQLSRIIEKMQAAVRCGELSYDVFESDREIIGQPSFMSITPSVVLPDIMRYHFVCSGCGDTFSLFVETYHGAGGRWWRSSGTPSNPSLKADVPDGPRL